MFREQGTHCAVMHCGDVVDGHMPGDVVAFCETLAPGGPTCVFYDSLCESRVMSSSFLYRLRWGQIRDGTASDEAADDIPVLGHTAHMYVLKCYAVCLLLLDLLLL